MDYLPWKVISIGKEIVKELECQEVLVIDFEVCNDKFKSLKEKIILESEKQILDSIEKCKSYKDIKSDIEYKNLMLNAINKNEINGIDIFNILLKINNIELENFDTIVYSREWKDMFNDVKIHNFLKDKNIKTVFQSNAEILREKILFFSEKDLDFGDINFQTTATKEEVLDWNEKGILGGCI